MLYFSFYEDIFILWQSSLCDSQRHPWEEAAFPARRGGFSSHPLPIFPQFLMCASPLN